jgi:hypothetical protein
VERKLSASVTSWMMSCDAVVKLFQRAGVVWNNREGLRRSKQSESDLIT